MEIKVGNLDIYAVNPDTKGGWFAGHFAKDEEFQQESFEIKWSILKKGEKKESVPVTDSRTLTVLLDGEFDVTLPKETVRLREVGDYVYFGLNVSHSWECISDARMLTIRWPSIKRS